MAALARAPRIELVENEEMPVIRLVLVAVLAAALSACEQESSAQAPGSVAKATDLAAQLTGDAAGAAADNPLCTLFTPQELASYVGEALTEGANAAMGSGCIWYAQDGEGDALIQVVEKRYHANPYLAEGYAELPGLGEDGNVSPAMGGWIATAIVGEESVVASVSGKSADAAQAEALLRETIERRGK